MISSTSMACYPELRFQYDAVGNHIITRDAKASWQMMTCLMNSCAPECLNKVFHSSEKHVITIASGEVSEDGPLFLCILVSTVVVDNFSTVLYYSHQLTCLDQLMVKVNCNIKTLMTKFKTLCIN